MFALCILAGFGLVSMSHSAPPACERLVRPLDELAPRHLEGRWALVVGSLNDSSSVERFKTRDSALILFANASDPSDIPFTRVFGFSHGCQYVHSNISLEGSSYTTKESNFTVTFLHTSCPDCLVMHFRRKPQSVYLFSRRRELGQREMEEFKAQSECLNMLPPVDMDPAKELCPEQVSKGHEETQEPKA